MQSLTLEEVGRAAPSVLAVTPYEGMSSKYLQIPTIDILAGLREEGYVPTSVMQSRSRSEGRKPFAKHLIRLRQERYLGTAWEVGEDVPEIVLVNSHDGGSAYVLMLGVFRLVCSNGLIKGDIHTTVRVRHVGNILDEVFKATYKIALEAPQTMDEIAQMKQITLEPREQLLLAKYASLARWPEQYREEEGQIVEGTVTYPPESLLQRRRREDMGDDLYTVMNVVQENALQGGARGRDPVTRQRKRSRAIGGIDTTVKIDTLLWQFAQELRAYKVGMRGVREEEIPLSERGTLNGSQEGFQLLRR